MSEKKKEKDGIMLRIILDTLQDNTFSKEDKQKIFLKLTEEFQAEYPKELKIWNAVKLLWEAIAALMDGRITPEEFEKIKEDIEKLLHGGN